jgi:hypothetical protein
MSYNNWGKKLIPEKPEMAFSLGKVYQHFNHTTINEILAELTVENSVLYLGSPDFTNETAYNDFAKLTNYSDLYKMQYIVEDIPPLEESTIETKVIQENKYIPAVEDTWTNCGAEDLAC